MLILNILTSQCLVRYTRRAAALAGLLSGRPASFTASRSSLIILIAALIFRNKLIPKMTENLIKMQSSLMGLVGIWANGSIKLHDF